MTSYQPDVQTVITGRLRFVFSVGRCGKSARGQALGDKCSENYFFRLGLSLGLFSDNVVRRGPLRVVSGRHSRIMIAIKGNSPNKPHSAPERPRVPPQLEMERAFVR